MQVTEETLQKFVDYHKHFERLYANFGIGLEFAYNVLEYKGTGIVKNEVKKISLDDLYLILNNKDVARKTISISENKFISIQTTFKLSHYIIERVGYRIVAPHYDTLVSEGVTLSQKGNFIPLPCTREAFDTGVVTLIHGNTKRKEALKTSLEYALVRNVLHRKFVTGAVGLNLTNVDFYTRGVLKAPSIDSIMNLLVRNSCGVKISSDGELLLILNASIRGNKGVTFLDADGVKDTKGVYYTGLLV